jgi:hypothetical protein
MLTIDYKHTIAFRRRIHARGTLIPAMPGRNDPCQSATDHQQNENTH